MTKRAHKRGSEEQAARFQPSRRLIALSAIGAIVVMGGLVVSLFQPKEVEFSYAGDTCTRELTLFPQIHKLTTANGYEMRFEGVQSLASTSVYATGVCFKPVESPEPGTVTLASAPWGSFPQQRYDIIVGEPPRANLADLKKPVPTTKPVTVTLDRPDAIYTYSMVVGKKTVVCDDKESGLTCDIEKLKLKQGASYRYQLAKQFGDESLEEVGEGTLKTLRAVRVKDSSVKPGQTVYAKPTSFKIRLDKPLVSAKAMLSSADGKEKVKVTQKDTLVTVTAGKQLKRETNYTLTLTSAEARDDSTLVEPYKIPFTMSGGPKIVASSIGSSRVDPGAAITLTFDQPIAQGQDMTKFIKIKGGAASVSYASPTTAVVQLQGLGRCVPFTISAAKGVKSQHGIVGTQAWSFTSRTKCYTTSVYGSSLQGRPLVAYHFGNSGPLTLYTGAIHGNEVSSMYMMQSWIAELEANPNKIGNRRIVVIPNINPDGVAGGTRNNSRDVNLSRNFPTSNWVKDINDTNGFNKGGGGKKPLSEPEAAALARFTQGLSPRLLVSYHAVGSMVIGDPGGYSAGKAAQYAAMVGYSNQTGAGGTFDYDITGSFEDWTYRNVGIPSMIIELGSYTYHDINHHQAAMWKMLDQ